MVLTISEVVILKNSFLGEQKFKKIRHLMAGSDAAQRVLRPALQPRRGLPSALGLDRLDLIEIIFFAADNLDDGAHFACAVDADFFSRDQRKM